MAKRTPVDATDIDTEELPLEDELETEAEAPAEEEVEEVEEEDDDPIITAPRQPQEEHIPKSRFDEVNARARILEQALAEVQAQRAQPQRPAEPVVQADPYDGLTPEAKNWAQFITKVAKPQIDQHVRSEIARLQQEQLLPLQRDGVVVKDLIDDQMIRRQHKDYHVYEDSVKDIRQQWYRETGVLAPREIAYAVAKLRRGQLAAPAERSATLRGKAKAGATTQSKQPNRKVAPKGPVSLDDVSRMSEADLEKALAAANVTF
jgi:hypothetical protein